MMESQKLVLIRKEDPNSLEAQALLDERDAASALFFGERGRSLTFHEEVRSPRSTFLVVRSATSFAIGCAALLRLEYGVAEVKYLYTRAVGAGVGRALLSRIERHATGLGYHRLVLLSHKSDRRTISFCNRNGFGAKHRCAGTRFSTEEAWFEKQLTSATRNRAAMTEHVHAR
ncbi:conserved hypothetical protein [Burkholderia sp. 8Y]|uniref:GNAT family N-acetyltransferase n=1 Tax=Burkholderia sp. 8Y TaxID=2653133 RepID=UPI0012F347B8|nr:GNAT family N-acetyltransferase [Burkholderia sp. 8Y]VXC78325.1 conserved hypothetical protein [Burkholderia sp. 8Y]